MQLKKAIGLLDDPGLDYRFAVDFRKGVEPFGHLEPVP